MKKIIPLCTFFILYLSFGNAYSVSILETFNTQYNSGEFIVTNNSGEDVFAFFVANNNAHQADKGGEGNELESWAPAVITRAAWEAGTIHFPDPPVGDPTPEDDQSDPFESFLLWTPPDTTTLNWDTVFGASYDKAFAYWSDGFDEVPQRPIAHGTTQGDFLFYTTTPASPFIAFGTDDTVAQGQTSHSIVPIPAAAWLFGSGLIALVGFSRRQNR